MKKKKSVPIIIIVVAVAVVAIAGALFAFFALRGNDETIIDIDIPYISRFACDYYDENGEVIDDKSKVFNSGDEIWVKTNFTLLPDAYAEGKSKFTVKFILSGDFAGKILSANSSATSDKDLTATFTADDKNPKNCEIETRINVNFSAGSLKIAYAYDDEEYTKICEFTLNNDKTLLYTYDKATDGYIVSRNSDNSEWFNSMEKVLIPDSYDGKPITIIDEELFHYCSNLTSVGIPNGITRIDSGAFDGCDNLQYNEYENAKYLGNEQNPYVVCIKSINADITSVNINDSVKIIYDGAFFDCTYLTSITIPDKVISIGENAFCGCYSLTNISIPNGVMSIGKNAFKNCLCIEDVYITDIAAWCSILFSLDNSGVFSNPLGNNGNLYLNGTLIKDLVIPNSVTNIGNAAFYGCGSLTSVTIPNSVIGIGNSAFRSSSVTDITIPNSVINIGDHAFMNCCDLTNVLIPSSVTNIGECAFYGCSSLTDITISDNVVYVGASTFEGCYNLKYNEYKGARYLGNETNPYVLFIKPISTAITSIDINDDAKVIYNRAFYRCSNLTSIAIPVSVKYIGIGAFYCCSSLTSITIPNSVTIIEKATFYGCSSLTNITLSDNITRIGDEAFGDCSGLIGITIPDGVTSIGDYTFSNCISLTSITIPKSVASIGDYAFSNCSSLTSITIPDSVIGIGYHAFEGCRSLKNVFFDGAKVKWETISMLAGKSSNNGNITIKCLDGELKFRFY